MSPDPLLSAGAADRARAAVARIRDHLEALPVGYSDRPGNRVEGALCLDNGRIGNALFWAYDAAAPGRHARIEAALDKAADELAKVPSLTPSLWAGFCGTAWVAEHVERRLLAEESGPQARSEAPTDADEEEDANDEIDTALATVLAAPPRSFSYDLPKGLAGFAVYALERHRRSEARIQAIASACLERIVEHFVESRVETEHGRVWVIPQASLPKAKRNAHPDGAFHRGLAHGVPSALVALARIAAAGIRPAECNEMAAEAVAWLRATEVGPPEVPSWCSAACGRAISLVIAGQLLAQPRWTQVGLELARAAAERPPTQLRDTGICHGTAGVAYTFQRLYELTGDEIVADAARAWMTQLLDQLDQVRGRARGGRSFGADTGVFEDRFGPHTAPPGHVVQPQERGGLMRGAAGVGLVLLAAIEGHATPAAWDRCLLLRA